MSRVLRTLRLAEGELDEEGVKRLLQENHFPIEAVENDFDFDRLIELLEAESLHGGDFDSDADDLDLRDMQMLMLDVGAQTQILGLQMISKEVSATKWALLMLKWKLRWSLFNMSLIVVVDYENRSFIPLNLISGDGQCGNGTCRHTDRTKRLHTAPGSGPPIPAVHRGRLCAGPARFEGGHGERNGLKVLLNNQFLERQFKIRE